MQPERLLSQEASLSRAVVSGNPQPGIDMETDLGRRELSVEERSSLKQNTCKCKEKRAIKTLTLALSRFTVGVSVGLSYCVAWCLGW